MKQDLGCSRHRGLARLVRLWLPVLAWAGLIFALSSVPDLGTGLGMWDIVLRKIAHAAGYAVLGALLVRPLPRPGLVRAEHGLAISTRPTSRSSPDARARPSTSRSDAVGSWSVSHSAPLPGRAGAGGFSRPD